MNLFEQISPRCDHCTEHDAYHEAGHTVMAVITYRRIRRELYLFYLKQIEDMQNLANLGIAKESDVEEAWDVLDKITRGPLDEISIVPDATSNGRTKRAYFLYARNVEDARGDPSLWMIAKAECSVAVAGFAAQRMFDPTSVVNQKWGGDAALPLAILNAIDGEDQVDRLREIMDEVETTLLKPEVWLAVESIAELLLEKNTVAGTEARALIEEIIYSDRESSETGG